MNDISYNEINEIEKNIIELGNKYITNITKERNVNNICKRNKGNSVRNKTQPLKPFYSETTKYEAGIDEAGRGPLFGRVYAACVILPRDTGVFNHSIIKDSKRFSSKKKLLEVYNYIKEKSLAYSVVFEDEKTIDEINIRQATLKAMNHAILQVKKQLEPDLLLVDGVDFVPEYSVDTKYTCIEGGDNWYTSIAAASILAKVERDQYIEDLCDKNPILQERYALAENKGYGTKKHLEGIRNFGISEWHRKTFGICKQYM